MLKLKYLWTLALVALCVSLASGLAFAQVDSWAVDDTDVPDGLAWGAEEEITIDAVNDGTTTWTTDLFELLAVDGTTEDGLVMTDRWGLTSVELEDDVDPDDDYSFEFDITGPPLTGTFDCNWILAKDGSPIETDLADDSVTVNRFPDIVPDTAGEWAADAIEACAGRVPPIVLGYGDGRYAPAQKVTRAQMAVYIRRGMGMDPLFPEEPTFDDVSNDPMYWAYGDIEALAEADVIGGYPDGTFQPEWIVDRAQMAVFIAAGADVEQPTDEQLEGITDPESEYYDPDYVFFPDVWVGFWADNAVYGLKDAEIVLGYGDGMYRPGAEVDRGQLAVYCYRAFIEPTDVPIVLGGPALTSMLTNPLTAEYDGWTSVDTDPGFAYVAFEDGAEWEVEFDFREAATPTWPGTIITVDAEDGATGDYAYASTLVPDLGGGDYLMVTSVEGVELARTVAFTVTGPPATDQMIPFDDVEVDEAMPEEYVLNTIDVTATFGDWWVWYRDEDEGSTNYIGQPADGESVSFDVDVTIPSLWMSNWFGEEVTVTGSLDGSDVWTFTNNAPDEEWVEVTDGDGIVIDTLTFTDCADSEVDDITVALPPPAPGSARAPDEDANDLWGAQAGRDPSLVDVVSGGLDDLAASDDSFYVVDGTMAEQYNGGYSFVWHDIPADAQDLTIQVEAHADRDCCWCGDDRYSGGLWVVDTSWTESPDDMGMDDLYGTEPDACKDTVGGQYYPCSEEGDPPGYDPDDGYLCDVDEPYTWTSTNVSQFVNGDGDVIFLFCGCGWGNLYIDHLTLAYTPAP